MRAGRSGGYAVRIGRGLLSRLPEDLVRGLGAHLPFPPSTVVVVSDRRVAALYGRHLTRALNHSGLRAELLTFPAGEANKTREVKARLEDRLARIGLGRDGLIVALGGGVTGDLAGFLAATWHRGIPLLQAPTSMIAMLDASIGGKVAVDHPLGKNLIGSIHPPIEVRADTSTLASLPLRDFRSGLAEAVKCGAIADAALFRGMERQAVPLLRCDPVAIERVIYAAAAVKARIVSRDERETGLRRLLNFGHTLGHALELTSGYRLRHGEAISLGMVLESALAVELGILREKDLARIEALLARLGLPTRAPLAAPPEDLLAAVRRDKKVSAGQLLFALPAGIGRHAGGGRFGVPVPASLVRSILAR